MRCSRSILLVAVLISFSATAWSAHAASLQVFAVVYGEVTNDIAIIESNFDGSSAAKQKLATLVRARTIILDPALSDEQALAQLVSDLAPLSDYNALLDESANIARSALLVRYAALGERVALLPPSTRSTRERSSYNALAAAVNDLNNAQHAGGIAAQLAPLGRRLITTAGLIDRARVLPRPVVGLNAVRATVNGKAFTSSSNGRHSANTFAVSAPGPLYRDLFCRVIDRSQVLTITLPVITDDPRYDVAEGLAALVATPDVFAATVTNLTATSGTFWVQSTKNEIYGIFSCAGPGLDVKNGRFRIQVPKTLQTP